MFILAFWLDGRRNRRVTAITKSWREIAETLNDYAKTLPDDIDKAVLLAAVNERVKCALELLWLFADGVKPPWIDKPDLIVPDLAKSAKDKPNVVKPPLGEHERESQ